MRGPDRLPGADHLVGTDGNIYAILARARQVLREAGADRGWLDALEEAVTSSESFEEALGICRMACDGDWTPPKCARCGEAMGVDERAEVAPNRCTKHPGGIRMKDAPGRCDLYDYRNYCDFGTVEDHLVIHQTCMEEGEEVA